MPEADRLRFSTLFEVDVDVGTLKVPEALAPKVERWFGKPNDVVDENAVHPAMLRAETQAVVSITNLATLEMTGGGTISLLNALQCAETPPPACAQRSTCCALRDRLTLAAPMGRAALWSAKSTSQSAISANR